MGRQAFSRNGQNSSKQTRLQTGHKKSIGKCQKIKVPQNAIHKLVPTYCRSAEVHEPFQSAIAERMRESMLLRPNRKYIPVPGLSRRKAVTCNQLQPKTEVNVSHTYKKDANFRLPHEQSVESTECSSQSTAIADKQGAENRSNVENTSSFVPREQPRKTSKPQQDESSQGEFQLESIVVPQESFLENSESSLEKRSHQKGNERRRKQKQVSWDFGLLPSNGEPSQAGHIQYLPSKPKSGVMLLRPSTKITSVFRMRQERDTHSEKPGDAGDTNLPEFVRCSSVETSEESPVCQQPDQCKASESAIQVNCHCRGNFCDSFMQVGTSQLGSMQTGLCAKQNPLDAGQSDPVSPADCPGSSHMSTSLIEQPRLIPKDTTFNTSSNHSKTECAHSVSETEKATKHNCRKRRQVINSSEQKYTCLKHAKKKMLIHQKRDKVLLPSYRRSNQETNVKNRKQVKKTVMLLRPNKKYTSVFHKGKKGSTCILPSELGESHYRRSLDDEMDTRVDEEALKNVENDRTVMLLRPNKKYTSVFHKRKPRLASTLAVLQTQTKDGTDDACTRTCHSGVSDTTSLKLDQQKPAEKWNMDLTDAWISTDKVGDKCDVHTHGGLFDLERTSSCNKAIDCNRRASTEDSNIMDEGSNRISPIRNGTEDQHDSKSLQTSKCQIVDTTRSQEKWTPQSFEKFCRSRLSQTRKIISSSAGLDRTQMQLRPNRKSTSLRKLGESPLKPATDADNQNTQCNSCSAVEVQGATESSCNSEERGDTPEQKKRTRLNTHCLPSFTEEQCTTDARAAPRQSNNTQSAIGNKVIKIVLPQETCLPIKSRTTEGSEQNFMMGLRLKAKRKMSMLSSEHWLAPVSSDNSVGSLSESSPEKLGNGYTPDNAGICPLFPVHKALRMSCEAVSSYTPKTAMMLRPYTRYRSIVGKPHWNENGARHWLLTQARNNSYQEDTHEVKKCTENNAELLKKETEDTSESKVLHSQVGEQLLELEQAHNFQQNKNEADPHQLVSNVHVQDCVLPPIPSHSPHAPLGSSCPLINQVASSYVRKIAMMLRPYTRYHSVVGKLQSCVIDTSHWLLAQECGHSGQEGKNYVPENTAEPVLSGEVKETCSSGDGSLYESSQTQTPNKSKIESGKFNVQQKEDKLPHELPIPVIVPTYSVQDDRLSSSGSTHETLSTNNKAVTLVTSTDIPKPEMPCPYTRYQSDMGESLSHENDMKKCLSGQENTHDSGLQKATEVMETIPEAIAGPQLHHCVLHVAHSSSPLEGQSSGSQAASQVTSTDDPKLVKETLSEEIAGSELPHCGLAHSNSPLEAENSSSRAVSHYTSIDIPKTAMMIQPHTRSAFCKSQSQENDIKHCLLAKEEVSVTHNVVPPMTISGLLKDTQELKKAIPEENAGPRLNEESENTSANENGTHKLHQLWNIKRVHKNKGASKKVYVYHKVIEEKLPDVQEFVQPSTPILSPRKTQSTGSQAAREVASDCIPKTVMMLRPCTKYQSVKGKSHPYEQYTKQDSGHSGWEQNSKERTKTVSEDKAHPLSNEELENTDKKSSHDKHECSPDVYRKHVQQTFTEVDPEETVQKPEEISPETNIIKDTKPSKSSLAFQPMQRERRSCPSIFARPKKHVIAWEDQETKSSDSQTDEPKTSVCPKTFEDTIKEKEESSPPTRLLNVSSTSNPVQPHGVSSVDNVNITKQQRLLKVCLDIQVQNLTILHHEYEMAIAHSTTPADKSTTENNNTFGVIAAEMNAQSEMAAKQPCQSLENTLVNNEQSIPCQSSLEKERIGKLVKEELSITKGRPIKIRRNEITAMKLRKRDKHFVFSQLGFKKTKSKRFGLLERRKHGLNQNKVLLTSCEEGRRPSHRSNNQHDKCSLKLGTGVSVTAVTTSTHKQTAVLVTSCEDKRHPLYQHEEFSHEPTTVASANADSTSTHEQVSVISCEENRQTSNKNDDNLHEPGTISKETFSLTADARSIQSNIHRLRKHKASIYRQKHELTSTHKQALSSESKSELRRSSQTRGKRNVNTTSEDYILPSKRTRREQLPLQTNKPHQGITREQLRKSEEKKVGILWETLCQKNPSGTDHLFMPGRPKKRGRPKKIQNGAVIRSKLTSANREQHQLLNPQVSEVSIPREKLPQKHQASGHHSFVPSVPRKSGRPKKKRNNAFSGSTEPLQLLKQQVAKLSIPREKPSPKDQANRDQSVPIRPNKRGRPKKKLNNAFSGSTEPLQLLNPQVAKLCIPREKASPKDQANRDYPVPTRPNKRGRPKKKLNNVFSGSTEPLQLLNPQVAKLSIPREKASPKDQANRDHSVPTRTKKRGRPKKKLNRARSRTKLTSSNTVQLQLSQRIQQLIPGYVGPPDDEEFTLEEFSSLESLEEAVEWAALESRSEERKKHHQSVSFPKRKTTNLESHLTTSSSDEKR